MRPGKRPYQPRICSKSCAKELSTQLLQVACDNRSAYRFGLRECCLLGLLEAASLPGDLGVLALAGSKAGTMPLVV